VDYLPGLRSRGEMVAWYSSFVAKQSMLSWLWGSYHPYSSRSSFDTALLSDEHKINSRFLLPSSYPPLLPMGSPHSRQI
jgi:hypothetical protein